MRLDGKRGFAMRGVAAVRGLLGRLARDTEGNALFIVTLSAFMAITLAGLGMDMSRAYLAKTSLQNACDAGVLAGRKAMAATGVYQTTERNRAIKMFNFNYHQRETNTSTPVFTHSADSTGHVNGSATTTMPTTLMQLFGYTSIPLSVQCSAELQMANADVMFVLDTTGSMADNADGTTCTGTCTTSKIAGLRNAIRSFYRTVAGAVTDKNNTRIRFGFVPYAMTVNARGLITSGAMPTSYFVDNATAQTKLVRFSTTPTYIGTPGTPVPTTQTYSASGTNPTPISSSNCTNYGNNTWPTNGGNPVNSGTAPANTTSTSYSWRSWTMTGTSGSTQVGTCVRNVTTTTTTYQTRYLATSFRYIAQTMNVAPWKGFGAVSVVSPSGITLYSSGANNAALASYVTNQPSSTNPFYNVRDLATGTTATGTVGNVTNTTSTWGGCIEERNTVNQLSMSPIPSGAYDMDLASAPSNDATRWKPYLADLSYWRGSYTTSVDTTTATATQTDYCTPAQMMQFTTVDTNYPNTVPTWLETYVSSLSPWGGTYHDIGMMWGARLGNPNGIFASNVNDGNLPSVSRHIIFMTDGAMANYPSNYTAWGVTQYDGRDAPTSTTDTDLVNYHNNRFLAACTLAKNMGYTIWVIGFGQTLTPQMTACASANRAYYASNTTTLTSTFQYIAGQVADLRINK